MSSYSADGNNCVEHGVRPDGSHSVRDTKDRTGGTLHFTRTAWHSFVTAIKQDRFHTSA
ncbi:DUF397 domain-containing protein [Allostreptomyces psammosilenae]|uniref:DUF397 domain-containing protein n=1 Tax=Allostreptomyces psammosilenae TaxID=1892865 RepID=A0A853A0E6_9ACTN|nr:DUF397 domain-containing protein [Allostreptomyces psammosilenae]NYI07845.1 hypothetical protein [Allostreptomyces psammosilenae]